MTKTILYFPSLTFRCVSSAHSKSLLHIQDVIYFPLSFEQHLQHNFSVLSTRGTIFSASSTTSGSRIHVYRVLEGIVSWGNYKWLLAGILSSISCEKTKTEEQVERWRVSQVFSDMFSYRLWPSCHAECAFPADGVSTRFSRGDFVECYELPLTCKHELISRNWVWAQTC